MADDIEQPAICLPYIGPATAPEPVPSVVALLELMLEKAEAGVLLGLGVAAVEKGDHDTHGDTLGASSLGSLHLAASRLQQSLLDHEDPD